MRLSGDEPIRAALAAGVTVFDTAHAYRGNEALVAGALRGAGARIVTKGGMRRDGDAWVPDGRAKAILADCEASLAALGGLPIDLYLIHAPDPRTPWATSVRALARLVDEGLVGRVGLSNVNRGRLDEALSLAPIAAVEVALSPFDDTALRGGVADRCAEHGIAVIAHSPLGGPRRVGALARNPALAAVADAHRATPAEVALAWLLALSPAVVAIPGARRPETARSAARAATLVLDDRERALLDGAFGRAVRAPRRRRARAAAEVVVIMGVPGAGKSRVADDYATRGYIRLNRDDRGGSLRDLTVALDEQLAAGARKAVLDNTYLTRAVRSRVLEVASRHGASTRCVWLDTPLAQAQVNMVERLLDRFGALPTPEELRLLARREPGLLSPTSQMRAARELEPPAEDEGFDSVEQIAFVRDPPVRRGRGAVFVAAAALRGGSWADPDPGSPHLVFDWIPDRTPEALEDVAGTFETAVCPHGGGPPVCWCRPPLPGLPLAFARRAGIDPARSVLVGVSPAHRALAATLGARYVAVQNSRT
jgi:aryl-alcohol dehydrogenase-like predicted oxidoreductase/predicted kinase